MNGCAKKYNFSSDIYLLSCIDLYFIIIIDRVVGAPKHRKYVVDGLNAREKWMINLAMSKISNN